MSNAPLHAAEHEDLILTLAKLTENSKLINGIVLITIGFDGRPCVGGNIASPAEITNIFRQLGASEDLIAHSEYFKPSKDN